MSDETVQEFPQHRLGSRKQSVAEFIAEGYSSGEPTDETFWIELLRRCEGMSKGQIDEEVRKAKRMRDADEAILEMPKIIEEYGIEQVQAWLAARPGQAEFGRLLDLAVAEDPYWEKTDEGGYLCKEGATHQDPEDLVAAYKRNKGLT